MTILKYSQITEAQYEDYIGEWEQSADRAIPAATQRKGRSFVELRSAWTEEESSAMYERRRVPATLYFFVTDTGRIVGAIHHRHELTESLALSGGHIGYGVRPSERGRGIASKMLESLLELLWDTGANRLLITCDDSNAASARVIEKAGGLLKDKLVFDGTVTRRYWIERPQW